MANLAITSTKPIRVMIADDQDVVRRGLSVFLTVFDDLQLVGQATNGAEAVDLCGQLLPDVILMDMVMPQMDGIAATVLISQNYPQTRVIGLSSVRDIEAAQRMIDAGAVTYLPKDASIDDLASAIRSASRPLTA